MQRSGMRGFNRPQRGTIKDRLGFQTPGRQKLLASAAAAAGKRTPAIKARLGGVAAATIGQVLDARQKINLNRVQKGRVGDARDKIEAKRRGKVVGNGNSKFKNLTITANVSAPPPGAQNMMTRGGGMGPGAYYQNQEPQLQQQQQQRQGPRFTAGYPIESSGMFRSAAMNTYHPNPPPPPISVGPSNNAFDHDGLFLTRTITNPAATAPNNNYASYRQQRSPLQSKPNLSAYRSSPYQNR